jgi:hypothetical protein
MISSSVAAWVGPRTITEKATARMAAQNLVIALLSLL